MKLFDLINLYLQNANTYSNQQVPTKTRIYLNFQQCQGKRGTGMYSITINYDKT